MRTRSLTILQDNDGTEIAVLYRQYDGDPSGHGADLATFLDGFQVTDGISSYDNKSANGGSCLAAQIVGHFKEGCGNFYLYPAGTRDAGEEYIYTVRPKVGSGVELTCVDPSGRKHAIPVPKKPAKRKGGARSA